MESLIVKKQVKLDKLLTNQEIALLLMLMKQQSNSENQSAQV
jgi:hypothetical protein